ncbi:MAG: hypothetical protein H7315_12230 [Herminiimonas sp.]|nr:hypothetical protein [Herminiimonas sp.]
MKSFAILVLLAALCQVGAAADITMATDNAHFQVERIPFGSGTPSSAVTLGTESAELVVDGLYHLPNYLPGFPTAATIWPRELPIECESDPVTGSPTCTGYRVLPAVGRGEYLFIRPVAKVVVRPPIVPVVAPMEPPEPMPLAVKKPLG